MFYEDFPSIPLILVITLQDRKTLVCIFLSFRFLPELKLIQDFFGALIFYNLKHVEHKKSTRGGPGPKRDQVVRGPNQATPPSLV
jgi:hypothetical protein